MAQDHQGGLCVDFLPSGLPKPPPPGRTGFPDPRYERVKFNLNVNDMFNMQLKDAENDTIDAMYNLDACTSDRPDTNFYVLQNRTDFIKKFLHTEPEQNLFGP